MPLIFPCGIPSTVPHFERLRQNIQESVASSEIHLDLMDSLRKMNSYSANVARA